jgi:hypothetical protein
MNANQKRINFHLAGRGRNSRPLLVPISPFEIHGFAIGLRYLRPGCGETLVDASLAEVHIRPRIAGELQSSSMRDNSDPLGNEDA